MVKVVKFGGSSLADAAQFKKVMKIINAENDRKYVVPSAPGKRSSDDIKVTDLLYRCYETAAKGEDITEMFAMITDRYNTIIKDLELDLDLSETFEKIKNSMIHKAGRDYAASRGEYLNGLIMAKALGYKFIDAADVIFFKDDGSLDSEKTNTVLGDVLKEHENAVIPGFYGIMPNDTIKTFSRGGSDITGSIVARAVEADLYENWTDVDGFLMADPRVVKNPCTISKITYRELRELSYMGATVLHEDAIFPVRTAGIPINIRNTNHPEEAGTMIVAKSDGYDHHKVITGIAGKHGFSVINIEKDMMNSEIGFGRKVLEVLEKEHISFEHLPSGIDTMSVVIATEALEGKRDRIINNLYAACSPDSVTIEDGIALIAVVGRGMKNEKGTAARVLKSIANADVNIRIIDQGSSEHNIIIGVDDEDFEKTVNAIYAEYVSE
ncbi:MAG: aspartate kinase [Ruminococcaceae bacterium]|nr:aspartate kinase [Oscillospiraceae bacterium]